MPEPGSFAASTAYGSSRETALTFTVEGQRLFGNLLESAAPAAIGVVFAHGFSGVRSGPEGLLTHLARALADAGLPSLRFDFRGRGESDGDGAAANLLSMADDLVAAVAEFRRRTQVRQIVLVGVCSGGNVAIGSLNRLTGIAGLVLFSVYPFSDGDAFGRDLNRTCKHLKTYWHKAWQLQTWQRLLRGELYYAQIAKVLFGHFRRTTATAVQPTTAAAQPQEGRFQRDPPRQHLEKLRCGIPGLLMYGAADPDADAANRYFGSFIEQHALPIKLETIPGANHNFSSQQWHQQLAARTISFCRIRLAAAATLSE